jgi:hypothetical protein
MLRNGCNTITNFSKQFQPITNLPNQVRQHEMQHGAPFVPARAPINRF